MLKKELVTEVAERATDIIDKQVTKKVVDAVLTAYADCVTDNIVAGSDDKVPFPGVGNFKAHKMPARQGVLSFGEHAGESWSKPEHYVLKFFPSNGVKDL